MPDDQHNAELRIRDSSCPRGPVRKEISWKWNNDRDELTSREFRIFTRLLRRTPEYMDIDEMNVGDRIACIWVENEEAKDVKWEL